MSAAFSYLGEIGAKSESDMFVCFFFKLRQGHSEVSLIVFLSTLDSAWRETGGKRREKKRGGGRGQLQCGQVCRVSRERERLRMKHHGIDWTGFNTG